RVSEVELEYSSQSLRNVSSLNVTSGELVTLKCISGISRPDPTIEWHIGGDNKVSGINDTFTFIPKSMDHDKDIFCRAYNVDPKITVDSKRCRLYVQVQVTEVKLYHNEQPVSDESILHVQSNKTVSISCVPGESRPDPVIEWYVGSEMRSSSARQFPFTLSNKDHSKPIYCRAYTLQPTKAVESYKPKLSVEDYPVIIYNVSSPLTVNETQSVTVTCEAIGNPMPNAIQWKERQEGNVLRYNNIKRQDTGTYTCEAKAESMSFGTLTSQKQLHIVVQYAPDIVVTVSGTTMKNQTVLLICEARGVPVNITFYPWIHLWKNDVIRTGLAGTTNSTHTTLLIDRLSLENSGTYICSATNGVPGKNGTFEQRGSHVINVTGNPIIKSHTSIFTGEIGQYVNISIPFFSNPAIECLHIQNNGTSLSNVSYITYLLPKDIDVQMHGKTVQLEAQVAHIVVQNLSPSDFENYTLMLRNPIGQTEFTFQLKSDGPPCRVEMFNFSRSFAEQIELIFYPGFNGGFEQTFVIEYSSRIGHDNVWHNTSVTNLKEISSPYKRLKETFAVNVSKLLPGDYLYRMYSWNVRGKSPYSESIRVIIPFLRKGLPDSNEQTTIVGGLVVSLFVIAVIAGAIIFQKRKSYQNKSPDDEIQDFIVTNRRNASHRRLEEIGKINIISLNFRRYSAVVYENVPDKNVIAHENNVDANASENGRDSADVCFADESVYENQFGVNRHLLTNKDCLIYADLELSTPKTNQGKPIIHGLDNRTEYAKITFGLGGAIAGQR
ncbi:hypothetical protein ACJMK2_030536, partial [Sinanodonta woodiana]